MILFIHFNRLNLKNSSKNKNLFKNVCDFIFIKYSDFVFLTVTRVQNFRGGT